MNSRAHLFGTVADRDYLGFWADQTLRAKEVADFLDFNKPDLAKVAGVAPTSIRFDHKIPKEVLDRLTEIANVCSLVAGFFNGDAQKTALWFRTKNPRFGNISPTVDGLTISELALRRVDSFSQVRLRLCVEQVLADPLT